MENTWLNLALVLVSMAALQGLAALPWLLALDARWWSELRKPSFWAKGAAVCVGGGAAVALYLQTNPDAKVLAGWGRVFMSVLHLQLAADVVVCILGALMWLWPKGAAVAYSAFRETIRQPMFLLLTFVGWFLMGVTPFVPYFTFGEDQKMVKEICYAWLMIVPGIMGVLTASITVSEEIEGRTAITLMSKPVSRRQFLLGKYAGILLASFAMTLFLGWWLVWIVLLDLFPLPGIEPTPDPAWTVSLGQHLFQGNPAEHLIRGMALWTHDAGLAAPNILIGFCQVMVLVALAVALATRLPMVVTLTTCLVIYFLGNLTSILTEVTRSGFRLVYFVAQLFDTLLPGLNLFDVGNAIVRDVPLPVDRYWWYAANVVFYGVIYSSIVLLFGLVLFEDRDLA